MFNDEDTTYLLLKLWKSVSIQPSCGNEYIGTFLTRFGVFGAIIYIVFQIDYSHAWLLYNLVIIYWNTRASNLIQKITEHSKCLLSGLTNAVSTIKYMYN